MVTGSVASMVYGEPRLTLDVDLVVELDVERVDELLDAFPESEFYRPPLEVVRLECSPRLARTLQPDPSRHGDEGRHLPGRARRSAPLGARASPPLPFGPGQLWLTPPEYVILRKLEFWLEGGSEKHLRDVRAMLAADLELDRTFLEEQLRLRGLEQAWRRVVESD